MFLFAVSYINRDKKPMIEGELRCEELASYLEKLHTPKIVWISEDASGIVPGVSYHSPSRQLVGLVLPLDTTTGMPIQRSFIPSTATDIAQQMSKPKATSVYLVMAQPIMENIPPFVLQLFGTDNTFTSQNVQNRWNHIQSELAKYVLEHVTHTICVAIEIMEKLMLLFFTRHGIQVAGISTDGDIRCLTNMKHTLTCIINSENVDVLLDIKDEQCLSVIQDPTHLAGKMRNRTQIPSVAMPMGQKQVSVGHLKMLIDSVSKDIHGLVRSDILPDDKQNFRSFEKITESRVLNALNQYVPDSEATIIYLKLSSQMSSAFMDPHLKPLERILKLWHAVYFLRIWRKWILAQEACDDLPQLSLDKNFISDNAFTCAELNAYGLLHIITKFRSANMQELFLPTLFQSQVLKIVALFS